MSRNIGWLANLVFAAFGAIFLYAALDIGDSFSGGSGHRSAPILLSAIVLVLSLLALAIEAFGPDVNPPGTEPILVGSFFGRVAAITILMVLNGLGQIGFGYLLSTFVCGVLVFRLFGNPWSRAVVHGAVGAGVLYLVFFGLMSLYEPPGRVLDLTLPF